MSLIRPYLIVLFLAVLMLHTVVPVAAADPPFQNNGGAETEKDEAPGHPTGEQYVFWADAIPEGEFYGVYDPGATDGFNPHGQGIRLIVIFRGGKFEDGACRIYAAIHGLAATPACTTK
jgi:hypothetical protein